MMMTVAVVRVSVKESSEKNQGKRRRAVDSEILIVTHKKNILLAFMLVSFIIIIFLERTENYKDQSLTTRQGIGSILSLKVYQLLLILESSDHIRNSHNSQST
jgi:hypothetical protein